MLTPDQLRSAGRALDCTRDYRSDKHCPCPPCTARRALLDVADEVERLRPPPRIYLCRDECGTRVPAAGHRCTTCTDLRRDGLHRPTQIPARAVPAAPAPRPAAPPIVVDPPCHLCGGLTFEPWPEDRAELMCSSCGHVCAHAPDDQADVDDAPAIGGSPETVGKLYPCPSCDRVFTTYRGLGGHTNIHRSTPEARQERSRSGGLARQQRARERTSA